MGEVKPGMRICGRVYLLLLATAAIISSLLLIFSCQFFSYRSVDGEIWEGFDTPFDELSTASVGLFRYSETTTSNENVFLGDQCLTYPTLEDAGHNVYFFVAQWCSIAAPIVAFLAYLMLLLEMVYCRLSGSFCLFSFLFFAAGALQGCSFLVFADTNFCFEPESTNKCSLKIGAWYSLGSTVAYLILALLSPSSPVAKDEERIYGCCNVSKKDESDSKGTDDAIEEGGSKTDEENEPAEEMPWTASIINVLCGPGEPPKEDSIEVTTSQLATEEAEPTTEEAEIEEAAKP